MTILVVEDEALINTMTSDDLRAAGHEVVSAYDADQAIDILEHRNDIDTIVTDIDMPGSMDGLRLAAAVRDRWPPVHIVITSGKATPKTTEMPSDSRFLAKPWFGSELVDAIQALRQ